MRTGAWNAWPSNPSPALGRTPTTSTAQLAPVPNKLLSPPPRLKDEIPSALTSEDAQAKVEVQQTSRESREEEAQRGEDAPDHHYGARPPAGAQGAAHWT